MFLLWWCPFQIWKEKWAGLQFTSTDYLSIVLTPVRIRWTIPLTSWHDCWSWKESHQALVAVSGWQPHQVEVKYSIKCSKLSYFGCSDYSCVEMVAGPKKLSTYKIIAMVEQGCGIARSMSLQIPMPGCHQPWGGYHVPVHSGTPAGDDLSIRPSCGAARVIAAAGGEIHWSHKP